MKISYTISNNGQETKITNNNGNSNQLSAGSIKNLKEIALAFIGSLGVLALAWPIGFLIISTLGLKAFFLFIALWSAIFLYSITRFGEWAAKYPAKSGASPISAEDLKRQIFSISEISPIKVTAKGTNKIELSWDYADEGFKYLFGLGKIRKGYYLLLKLDPNKNNVYAGETLTTIKVDANGLIKPTLSLKFSFFKGIVLFKFDYGKSYGLKIENGKPVFNQLYQYKFNPDELKYPLIQLITENGWNYLPKVFIT